MDKELEAKMDRIEERIAGLEQRLDMAEWELSAHRSLIVLLMALAVHDVQHEIDLGALAASLPESQESRTGRLVVDRVDRADRSRQRYTNGLVEEAVELAGRLAEYRKFPGSR